MTGRRKLQSEVKSQLFREITVEKTTKPGSSAPAGNDPGPFHH